MPWAITGHRADAGDLVLPTRHIRKLARGLLGKVPMVLKLRPTETGSWLLRPLDGEGGGGDARGCGSQMAFKRQARGQTASGGIRALPLASCVTQVKVPNLSVRPFPCPYIRTRFPTPESFSEA